MLLRNLSTATGRSPGERADTPQVPRLDVRTVSLAFDALAVAHDRARSAGVAADVDVATSGWLDVVARSGPGRAFDVGGGAGHDSLVLAEYGWTVDLVDVSPGMVRLARRRLDRFPGVRCHTRDARAWLRGRSGPVDLVLALGETLCYLPETAEALTQLTRSVDAGGWLIFSYLNADRLQPGATDLVMEREEPPLWIRALHRNQLVEDLRRTGLRVVDEWRGAGPRSAFLAQRPA